MFSSANHSHYTVFYQLVAIVADNAQNVAFKPNENLVWYIADPIHRVLID